MLATYVTPQRTVYSFDDLAYALEVGLASVLGKQPSRETLSVALAKCRLETGNGQFAWCHNLGNVKCPEDRAGMFTAIELNEVIKGKIEWFAPQGKIAYRGGPVIAEASTVPPGHYQTRMCALENRVVAGHFYIDFVAGKKRYRPAFDAMLAGNAEMYATLLGQEGYYTAPIPQYVAGVVKLAANSLAKLNGQPHEELAQPEKWEWHNQLVLDGFVATERERDLETGAHGGRDLLDYEKADTDPSELKPDGEA